MVYRSTFYQWLVDHASRTPAAPAIGSNEAVLDYASLLSHVDRVAGKLLAVGLESGDRALVLVDGSPSSVIALLGVAAADGVLVPLHPSAPGCRIAAVAGECDARLIVQPTGPVSEHHLATVGFEDPVALRDAGLVVATRRRTGPTWALGSSPRVVLYTSGTTGQPKGAMFTETALAWTTDRVAATLASRPGDVVVSPLSLAFTYGFSQLLISLYVGSCLMFSKSRTLDSQLALVRNQNATGFPVVPSILSAMIRYRRDWYSFPAVRYVTTSGSSIAAPVLQQARSFFPNAAIFSMYGTTECGRVAMMAPEELYRRPRSVGRPLDGLETRLVDEDGQTVLPGEAGELLVRGPGVMQGYIDDARAQCPQGIDQAGWVHTGDLFCAGNGNYLEFVARSDAIIKSSGFRVSPREVEEALATHPGVLEVVVVGMPHELLGEAIIAYVVTREGMEIGDLLRRHCAIRLEPFKLPHEIHPVAAIPRNVNGKVDTEALTLMGSS